jgi:hypothetical protein
MLYPIELGVLVATTAKNTSIAAVGTMAKPPKTKSH